MLNANLDSKLPGPHLRTMPLGFCMQIIVIPEAGDSYLLASHGFPQTLS